MNTVHHSSLHFSATDTHMKQLVLLLKTLTLGITWHVLFQDKLIKEYNFNRYTEIICYMELKPTNGFYPGPTDSNLNQHNQFL
jgi:hypothetical protein